MAPKFSYQNPTIGEYNDLRKSVDWPTFAPKLVERALANSLFSVVAHDDGHIIGLGRIVGDGALFTYPGCYCQARISAARNRKLHHEGIAKFC